LNPIRITSTAEAFSEGGLSFITPIDDGGATNAGLSRLSFQYPTDFKRILLRSNMQQKSFCDLTLH